MTDMTIEGRYIYNQRWLQADTLTFKPGSILVFSRSAIEEAGGRLVIMARKIVCDQLNPGEIEWEKPPFTAVREFVKLPDATSYDPTGDGDQSVGAWGGDGNYGISGDIGANGADAPSLELWILGIEGVGPKIDLRGQNGQNGGNGQDGQNGGNGQKGRKGLSGVFDCRRGGGYGGKGGNGGHGGKGGSGGSGGKGGLVYIFAPTDKLSVLEDKTRSRVAGGDGGDGGDGGKLGDKGGGGDGGNGEPIWCRDETINRKGDGGIPGHPGEKGSKGNSGNEGDVITLPITVEAFEHRLSSQIQPVNPVPVNPVPVKPV